MNKKLTKLIAILCALATQNCIIEIDPRPGPRPAPDVHCHSDYDCPVSTYCAIDDLCRLYPTYSECYSDRDCQVYEWCSPEGLCYDESFHECYTQSDCPVGTYCGNDRACHHVHR